MTRRARLSAPAPAMAKEAAYDGHDRGCEMVEADIPMTIGEVAREFGMTLRALRFYETRRLLAPQRNGAIRLYRRSDRERIALILTGRRLGFTLAEINDLISKPDSEGLHLSREQCVEQINLLEQQKRGLEIAIAELRQIYTSFYRKLLDGGPSDSRAGDDRHARRGAK